jgi:uncharacterized membrane protein (UPF0127 family)
MRSGHAPGRPGWGERSRPPRPRRGVDALPSRLDRLPARRVAGGRVLHEAAGTRARLLGLVALGALPPAHGLWLPRTRSVHTCGMRFALDLLWCGADGTVVRIDGGVGPGRVRGCRAAAGVVEVAAGAGPRWAAALAGSGTMGG